MKFNFALWLAYSIVSYVNIGIAQSNSSQMSVESFGDFMNNHKPISLDSLVQILPPSFKESFILKHGNNLNGLRGHAFEPPSTTSAISQSADAMAPRIISFNDATGFSFSFNGGVDEDRLMRMIEIDNDHHFKALHEKELLTNHFFGLTKVQSVPHRLDVLNFDYSNKKFDLLMVDFLSSNRTLRKDASCISCHGPSERPIFSMYPDWPLFYGSDNDELVGSREYSAKQNAYQEKEFTNYKQFLKNMNLFPEFYLRFSPFYNQKEIESLFRPIIATLSENNENLTADISQWVSYPFRPKNTIKPWASASRAFAFRPGLRFGIVQNRNMAIKVAEDIIKSRLTTRNNSSSTPTVFSQFGLYFMYQLLQCEPKNVINDHQGQIKSLGSPVQIGKVSFNSEVNNRWSNRIQLRLTEVKIGEREKRDSFLNKADAAVSQLSNSANNPPFAEELANIYVKPVYTQKGNLNYKQLWALFQLMVRDIDIRFSWAHKGYSTHLDKVTGLYTATGKLKKNAQDRLSVDEQNLMDVGYIGNYFNSYFDGSATIDELVAAKLYAYFKEHKIIQSNVKLEGLISKYAKKFPDRFKLDGKFFKNMDQLGQWIPIPIPSSDISSLFDEHHRETYKNEFAFQHNELCREVGSILLK